MGIFGIGRFVLSRYCVFKRIVGAYLGILPGIKKSRFGTMKDRRIDNDSEKYRICSWVKKGR